MKYIVFPALLLLMLSLSFSSKASTGSISGKVVDDKGKAVFANVILLRGADSTVVKTDITNDKGEYNITPVADGNYILKVMSLGFNNYTSGTLTINGSKKEMPTIKLTQIGTELKEVGITVQKPFLEVRADKIVVNVDNSIISAGSSVMEVLSRSPGVTVDQNDNISLRGKQGVNVMIDGRIQPISAADLANLLKSTPSTTVDKIEIIANPSAKYDAAGTGGIINIITKKDKRLGMNGSVTATYAQGVYPKENFGINLNYRQKKLNVYLNYNNTYRQGFSKVSWDRRFFRNDTFNGAFVQQNYTTLSLHNHIIATGIDYNISSKTSVGASVTAENFYLGTDGYYFANVYDSHDTIQSFSVTDNTSGGNWYNYAPNVHFKHTFDSVGKEITADLDYAHYWNNNGQDFTTRYMSKDGAESLPRYVLHGDIMGVTDISSFKIDYTNPFKNNARFEAGIKASFVTANNEPKFYNRSNGGNSYDSGISDHYLYHENINAAYINAIKDWTKWSTQVGLRAEQTVVDGKELTTGKTFDNNYLRLFPSFAVQYHLNKDNDLGINLSRRIERPGYQDLNPYIFFVDPTTYKVGNPQLQPALTYAADLSYTYKQRFITTLSYSITDNVITEVIKPSTTQDKVTIQTKDNLATMNYIGISGSYTLPLKKWWTNITSFDAYYANYVGNLSNTNLNAGKPTFDVNTSNKFTFPADWSAEFTVFYQAEQVYGFLNLTPISMFNIGIQKNLLKRTLTIRLSANDIFWHGNESGSSYFVNYSEVFNALHDTRQVGLSVTYRFGKKTVSPVQRHSGGAEDEKKRATDKGAG